MQKTEAGLCACCRHARRVVSDRGSVFYQCRRSSADSAFPRYPTLPVLRCKGFENEVAGMPQGLGR
jgi:hypothetical protein